MSLHTKTFAALTTLCGFAVCMMAFIAVDENILPTMAVRLVPFVFYGAVISLTSYGLDLLSDRA